MRLNQLPLFGVVAALLAWLPFQCLGAPPQPLPALNVDIAETSISGISSGAFMSVQFQVAHSSIIKGAGIVAGGPYYCSQDDAIRATTKCSCTLDPLSMLCLVSATSADVVTLERITRQYFDQGLIDDPEHLKAQKVYIFTGLKDKLVPTRIATQLDDYYLGMSIPPGNITMVRRDDAGHTMPTVAYGSDCGTDPPFIGKCAYDGAKEILQWIYGPLKDPRINGRQTGRFVQFDQASYLPKGVTPFTVGMDDTGWVYIPAACRSGERCRLHVALHGCKQGQGWVPVPALPPDVPSRGMGLPPDDGVYYGTRFVAHAGYDVWADTNNIVVLFPQAVSIPPLKNPNGCWDWWGYTGKDYANKKGPQISAVRAMIERIASGRH